MEKMASDGPKWGQEDFFLLIQTLPTFSVTQILILIIFAFLGSEISRFPDRHGPGWPGLAWAWAGVGRGGAAQQRLANFRSGQAN